MIVLNVKEKKCKSKKVKKKKRQKEREKAQKLDYQDSSSRFFVSC